VRAKFNIYVFIAIAGSTDTSRSAGKLLVPVGIVRPVISVSTLT